MNYIQITHPWRGIRPWKRHSLVLLVAGIIYVLIGVSYILTEAPPARTAALKIALSWWDLDTWGVIFILAGLMGMLSARWPPISETWGYTVFTWISSAWAAFYAVGILFGDSPLANVAGVLSWGLLGFLWWAISGLVNPPVVVMEVPENGRN